jgi:hypothetical protein
MSLKLLNHHHHSCKKVPNHQHVEDKITKSPKNLGYITITTHSLNHQITNKIKAISPNHQQNLTLITNHQKYLSPPLFYFHLFQILPQLLTCCGLRINDKSLIRSLTVNFIIISEVISFLAAVLLGQE